MRLRQERGDGGGWDGHGPRERRDCIADRWWRALEGWSKIGQEYKNVVGWPWLCIAWVAIRGLQTGCAFVVARPRPQAWAAVLLPTSSRPIRLPATCSCGDDGWTPGARENAIMAHLMDEKNLLSLYWRCPDNSNDAS